MLMSSTCRVFSARSLKLNQRAGSGTRTGRETVVIESAAALRFAGCVLMGLVRRVSIHLRIRPSPARPNHLRLYLHRNYRDPPTGPSTLLWPQPQPVPSHLGVLQ